MSISNGFPGIVKLATKTRSGLMSTSDKIKLDSINPGEISEAKEDIQKLKDVIIPTKTYTVRIDLNNKDPYQAVSYKNDAIGFEPLYVNQTTGECNYGSWKDVISNMIKPKPCLLQGDKVISYLDENNYARSVYGSGVDILNESSGNVMVEFSKVYYKLEKTGNIIDFSISDKKIDDTWRCDAFISEDGLRTEKDYMYYSAYEGWLDSDNKLRSLSDKIPTVNRAIYNYRSYARNNGNTYSIINISKRMYISLITIMVTKSLNIKTSIGLGVSDLDYTGDNRAIKSGTMNTKGLFFGNNTGKDGNKVFGIENFTGNLSEFVEGLIQKNGVLFYKKSYPYNDNASGYTSTGDNVSESGWVKSVKIMNGIIIPSEVEAASNNYFASYVYIPEDSTLTYACAIGGSYYMNQSCGHLCMDFRYETETTSYSTGSRIVSC